MKGDISLDNMIKMIAKSRTMIISSKFVLYIRGGKVSLPWSFFNIRGRLINFIYVKILFIKILKVKFSFITGLTILIAGVVLHPNLNINSWRKSEPFMAIF